MKDNEKIMMELSDSFKSAIESLNLAAVSVCSFYDRFKASAEKMRDKLGSSVVAFEADSNEKDRKHSEQKQKLDGIVADAEKQLHEAKKALSVAFTTGNEQEQQDAKCELSEAEIDLSQAESARSVFDEAVGVQYDEKLYNQIFSTEADVLNLWQKIAGYRKQVDESASSTTAAIDKAKRAAAYTDFTGLSASKRESLQNRFNHSLNS